MSPEIIHREIVEKLDALPKETRTDFINEIIERLEFEKRWQGLAANQIRHLCDESLSDAALRALDDCKTDEERNVRIDMYARSLHFRKLAWIGYLNDDTDEPPIAGQQNDE